MVAWASAYLNVSVDPLKACQKAELERSVVAAENPSASVLANWRIGALTRKQCELCTFEGLLGFPAQPPGVHCQKAENDSPNGAYFMHTPPLPTISAIRLS